MSNKLQFTISFPTDSGFVGRECNQPECKRYFKVHMDFFKKGMYCPYCGAQQPAEQLWTEDQLAYARKAMAERAKEYMYGEFDKMFADLARKSTSNSKVRLTHNPINYTAKPVAPSYSERQMDTELACPACSARFQVYGIFGYCPGCHQENMLIYDANLIIIKKHIQSSPDQQRELRHAYNDLISTFEAFCHKKAPPLPTNAMHFQDIYDARRFFRDDRQIDILDGFTSAELLLLRRVFNKRHVYQHNQGTISNRYIKKVPEDAKLLGQMASLSLAEFEQAALLIRRVLDRLL